MAAINAKIVRWTHALRQQGEKKISYRETQVHRDFMTGTQTATARIESAILLEQKITELVENEAAIFITGDFNMFLVDEAFAPIRDNFQNAKSIWDEAMQVVSAA